MKKYKKIYIEITNVCNLNCSFCSPVKRKRKFMSTSEFETILKKVNNYTDIIYLHVKGEPLIHPQIIEMIQLAEKYKLKVNITTNGVLFEKYSKELGKFNNISKINFSLHSENNKHNYLESIFNNINHLSNNTTIIYRLWTLKDGRLDKKSTNIVDKIKKHYKLSTEDVEKIIKERNIKIKSSIYVDKDNYFEWPHINKHNSRGYCHALKTHIAILVDGTVVPCCLDSNGIIELGNIYNQELDDIIKSQRYQNLRKSFQDRYPTERLCQSCTFKEKF